MSEQSGSLERPMTDEEKIGAVIDEMYARISRPAGPRDWDNAR